MHVTESRTARTAPLVSAFVLIVIAAALCLAGTPSASAASITVNTQGDAKPPADEGFCSLREAIFNANNDAQTFDDCAAGAGEDTIVFAPAVTMITLADDMEVIRDLDGLTIDGNDTVTVSGAGQYGIFLADTNVGLTLNDITLTNGKGALESYGNVEFNSGRIMNSNASFGGGIAIYQGGTGVITDSDINGNSALSGNGGAIYNEGHTTITSSIIQGNHASMNGGDIYNFGLGTLTINGGSITNGDSDLSGGGIYNEGAILNLSGSAVKDNMATDDGGGIWNSGELNLNGILVQANSAAQNGGGIYSIGSTTLDGSEVSQNAADSGAGIYNDVLGTLDVKNDSHVDSNVAVHDGGGINNLAMLTVTGGSSVNLNQAGAFAGGINDSGDISVTSSTISFNSAPNGGGGISIGDSVDGSNAISITSSSLSGNATNGAGGGINSVANGTALTVLRSTINDNTAATGGGIRQDGGTAAISNSTLSHNTAMFGGGLYNGANNTATLTNATVTANLGTHGSGIYTPEGEVTAVNLHNTIVADQNISDDCEGPGFHSLGNNLDSSGECNLNQPTDRPQANVFLGPLADNGGPTKTHALLANSEAIDAGNDAVCAASPISGKDQRGTSRPGGPHCDIGAYEFVPPATPTPTSAPTPTPTSSAVQQTELWADNDCSGVIDTNDVQRGLFAAAAPELLDPVSGCPDMGEELQFVDAHTAGAGHLIWGDVHCGDGLNGQDALDVLRFVSGLGRTSDPGGLCPQPGDVVVFVRE